MLYPQQNRQSFKRPTFKTKIVIISGISIISIGLVGLLLINVVRNSEPIQDETPQSAQTEAVFTDPGIDGLRLLWSSREFQQIVDIASEHLKENAVSFYYLLYRGFSSFYLGVSQPSFEERTTYLDYAIADLRMALAVEPYRQNADIFYILGKAYYHKGYFYHDLAEKYLLKSLDAGYRATDLFEYLGLVNSDLGQTEKAIAYFEQALQEGKQPIVMLSLASAHIAIDKFDIAMDYVNKAIASTTDKTILERARFIRGDLFNRQGKNDLALAEYESILKDNPNSADAHFYLGEAYAGKGDTIKARAQWREAYALDPKHSGAINRLNS